MNNNSLERNLNLSLQDITPKKPIKFDPYKADIISCLSYDFVDFLRQTDFLNGIFISSVHTQYAFENGTLLDDRGIPYINNGEKPLSLLRVDFSESKYSDRFFVCDMGTITIDPESLYVEIKKRDSTHEIIDWLEEEKYRHDDLFNQGFLDEETRIDQNTGEEFIVARLTF